MLQMTQFSRMGTLCPTLLLFVHRMGFLGFLYISILCKCAIHIIYFHVYNVHDVCIYIVHVCILFQAHSKDWFTI